MCRNLQKSGSCSCAIRGASKSTVMGVIKPDCYIRDGLLIERPLPVTQTFLAVAGVTQHLLSHARELEVHPNQSRNLVTEDIYAVANAAI